MRHSETETGKGLTRGAGSSQYIRINPGESRGSLYIHIYSPRRTVAGLARLEPPEGGAQWGNFTETKKQRPNTGARANNTLHKSLGYPIGEPAGQSACQARTRVNPLSPTKYSDEPGGGAGECKCTYICVLRRCNFN